MKIANVKGFTLVELMVALLLSSLVLAAVGLTFRSQQKSYIAQEEVAEMQQELRAGMEIITREIRNAGHDMTPNKTTNAGFVVASPFQVQFTMDLGDGAGGDPDGDIADADENVAYALSGDANADGIPDVPRFADIDGTADGGVITLGRNTGGGLQDLVTNIHAIGFAYAFDSDDDGQLETYNTGAGVTQIIWAVPDAAGDLTPLGNLDQDIDGDIDSDDVSPVLGTANATALTRIRAVRIWILARASRADPSYTDASPYKVGANVIGAPNDNFRRRLLTANVRCRNMGIVPVP